MVCRRQLTTGESRVSAQLFLPKLRGKVRRGDSDHGRAEVKVDRTEQKASLTNDRPVHQTRATERQNTPSGAKLPSGLILVPFAIVSGVGHFDPLDNGRMSAPTRKYSKNNGDQIWL